MASKAFPGTEDSCERATLLSRTRSIWIFLAKVLSCWRLTNLLRMRVRKPSPLSG